MPLLPVFHGLRVQITVADLTATDVVEATCPACRHQTRTAPWQLLLRHRASARLVDLAGKMTCRRCGHKGAQAWAILRATPPLELVEPPPKRPAWLRARGEGKP